jgi:3-oxoacyl-[acyl-carrier protein] reductase
LAPHWQSASEQKVQRWPAELARQVPVGRLGSPDELGAAVVYVASDEAAWLTGQTINLNGGSTSL